jgi:hypothetical protein
MSTHKKIKKSMKKVNAFFEEHWKIFLVVAAWFGTIGFIAHKLGI